MGNQYYENEDLGVFKENALDEEEIMDALADEESEENE